MTKTGFIIINIITLVSMIIVTGSFGYTFLGERTVLHCMGTLFDAGQLKKIKKRYFKVPVIALNIICILSKFHHTSIVPKASIMPILCIITELRICTSYSKGLMHCSLKTYCRICLKQLSHRRMPSSVCTASLSSRLHSGQIIAALRGSNVFAQYPGMI